MPQPNCECDYDCEDGSYFRCNRSVLCPSHDECEGCEAALAVKIVDGVKLCQGCLDDLWRAQKQREEAHA